MSARRPQGNKKGGRRLATALEHDGDPLPGSPSPIPLSTPTAGLGAAFGDRFRALKLIGGPKVAPSDEKNLLSYFDSP